MNNSIIRAKTLLWIFIATISAAFVSCDVQRDNIPNQKIDSAKTSVQTKANSRENLDIYLGCPMEGNTVRKDIAALNLLKNRYHYPQNGDFDYSITLRSLLESGDDEQRWNESKAVKIAGYVYDVKVGGVETCNCKTKDRNIRDTHIELTLDPNATDAGHRFVAEVTPRIRHYVKSDGGDWSTRSLRDRFLGRYVVIEGWLFFDNEHADEADNTAPGRERNWRKTAWEVHPITSIELSTRLESEKLNKKNNSISVK